MNAKDSLGDRMKRYEAATGHHLVPRTPAILRVDGKAFHTLTKNMSRPWDQGFFSCMMETAQALHSEVQGSKMTYFQSDEISVLLTDYDSLDTQAWFDGKVQKMVSVGAGIATAAFNRAFVRHFPELANTGVLNVFDARIFNLPKEEVVNYFIWRQQDASRNSVQMLARTNFSHKECHGLSCPELQEKLFQEKGLNWNDTPTQYKRGACVKKDPKNGYIEVDFGIPIFTAERGYVESCLPVEIS